MTGRKWRTLTAGAVLCSLVLGGCAFYARGPDDYREAVRKVLEPRNKDVERCYRTALDADPKATGKVVVRFDVEPKSGNIVNTSVVDKKTTANSALQQCVLTSLEGLKLDPPDQRKGEATFAWDFTR